MKPLSPDEPVGKAETGEPYDSHVHRHARWLGRINAEMALRFHAPLLQAEYEAEHQLYEEYRAAVFALPADDFGFIDPGQLPAHLKGKRADKDSGERAHERRAAFKLYRGGKPR